MEEKDMKKETSRYITLTPEEGKVLYNGKVLSSCVFLPITADVSVWREIGEAEAEAIRQAEEND